MVCNQKSMAPFSLRSEKLLLPFATLLAQISVHANPSGWLADVLEKSESGKQPTN